MDNTKTIQEAIKKYLADTGKNTVDLAKQLKVSKTTTARWVSGKAKIIRNNHWFELKKLIPTLETPGFNLSVDETLLLKSYREFSSQEKESALEEFAVKAAYKKAHKAG